MTTQGKLFLIPSPISPDHADAIVSSQVRQVLSSLDVFFVENVRTSRRFISSLQLGIIIEKLDFYEFNKESADREAEMLIGKVEQGVNAGVLSEAGCPGIADPGARLVALAHERGIEVVPLVGPSSIFLALMASGFSGQSFTFHGYLPIDKGRLRDKLRQMEKEANSQGTTQIFMETPYRNNQLMDALLTTCAPSTLLCVARNITADSELIRTLPVAKWKLSKPDLHKMPVVFLIGK